MILAKSEWMHCAVEIKNYDGHTKEKFTGMLIGDGIYTLDGPETGPCAMSMLLVAQGSLIRAVDPRTDEVHVG